MAVSEIRSFYNAQNILITGGTGFLGKALIEKLLRSTEIAKLYILVREKKGKNIERRINDIFDDVLFEKIKSEQPDFQQKIIGIPGDCSVAGLGLNLTDRQKLINNVDIIFHVAATVRFDEDLKLAYAINVNAIGDIIELGKHMKKLKSIIHVSTAYSNCYLNTIDEKFYEQPVSYETIGSLLEKLTEQEANKLTPRIIGKWPNTYTFTKALAESLVKSEFGGLPIGIFRPSIVLSTYKEPISGWTDNLNGPTAGVIGTAVGLVRVLYSDPQTICDLVPVDMCVDAMIAAAWDVGNKIEYRSTTDIQIYNYVSSVENSITWGEFIFSNKYQHYNFPLTKTIWPIRFKLISDYNRGRFLELVYHLLPAFLFDCGLKILGRRPKFLKIYKKIHKFTAVTSFFSTRSWKFYNNNIVNLYMKMNDVDRKLFPFSMKHDLNWMEYFRTYFMGIRVYLLKDSLSTLDEAKQKRWWLETTHKSLVFLFHIFIAFVIWYFISIIL